MVEAKAIGRGAIAVCKSVWSWKLLSSFGEIVFILVSGRFFERLKINF
jgi:hypothetical protein